ncbi:MAG: FtsW/RodA/SpoVE family cell cycle protein [Chloroflexi bacterium]|nr:FtsW/RodA/SpoVE family cell cycle protein [Chloroflexota bacterium]
MNEDRPGTLRHFRTTELALLLFPLALAVVGTISQSLVRGEQVTLAGAGPVAVIGLGGLAIHILLTLRAPQADETILPITLTLAVLGLLMIGRLTPHFGTRQMIWLALGMGLLGVLATRAGDLRWLRRYRYSWAALGLVLLALTLIIGFGPAGTGARLWLGIGSIGFQPSEPLKVLLVVFLASYLAERREQLRHSFIALGPLRLPPLPYLAPMVVVWAFSLLLLVAQRDLGAALLFFGLFLAMLYMATAQSRYIIFGLLLFVVGAYACYLLIPHVRLRVTIWRNPWADPQGAAFQVVQGLIAIGAGGLFGQGLGQGSAGFVPLAHSDYILAALTEEWGLAGLLAVIGLYVVLLERGLRIAMTTKGTFSKLLAAGLSTLIALQAIVISGGVLKVIPLTGITLPLISYGGSSLLTTLAAIGLILHISGRSRA